MLRPTSYTLGFGSRTARRIAGSILLLLTITLSGSILAEKGDQGNMKETVISPGEAFLAGNADKPGITVTASGLQYEIIHSGDGKKPSLSDTVVTHYAGRFIDGSEFDSSIKRGQPATFPVGGVIAGWTEALQLMREGDKWRLFIPSELAYGKSGRASIPANSTLIFDIELIEVK